MNFWETNKESPIFELQEALKAYHSKVLGYTSVFIDIGDITISPEEDCIDLFISLILSSSIDKTEKVTIDGVVSKYIEVSTIGAMDKEIIKAIKEW